MILTKEIEVVANSKNYKHYKDLGYNPIIKNHWEGNRFLIKPEHLPIGSHQKILCACDVCGKEKYVKNLNYNRYIKTDPNGEYTCEKCNLEKRKSTCLKIYGKEFVSQNENIKIKMLKTMKENGNEFFWCRKEEHKAKMMELYGVEYISQNEDIKNKIKKTNLELYGVENVSQNKEIHLRQHNGYILKHYNGLYYRGTYEKNFLDYCISNMIKIENFKNSIDYEFNGKNKKYFPDFYYEPLNLIVEIKSDYTYEKEREMNEAKKIGAINNGFNFIFIINKNYNEFDRTLKNQI